MNPHAHICLCDEEWIIYYDYVIKDCVGSVSNYLKLIFDLFSPDDLPFDEIEYSMYQRLEEKSKIPIYFKSGDTVYLWAYCTGCKLSSLN